MGTRARVNIIDGNQVLVSIYRQFDGYPDGLGQELADFCAPLKVVNGFGFETDNQVNGMGCFAAFLIKHLKEEIGNVYIRDTSDESHGEEYSYDLRDSDGKIYMNIYEGSVTAFGLPGDKQSNMKAVWSGYCEDFDIKLVRRTY